MQEIKDKKSYEASFVSATEEGAKKFAEALKSAGAELVSGTPLTRIQLAYPIEKKEEAYFGCINFNVEPQEIAQLEKQLRVQPPVLRFLIITPPFLKQKERRQYVPKRKTSPTSFPAVERKQVSHLSNEALEKQLKEILQ